ncbi:hypothetical protein MHTCC0001_35590 [Flavobacteriaceae bacterium MHTCC 0001]
MVLDILGIDNDQEANDFLVANPDFAKQLFNFLQFNLPLSEENANFAKLALETLMDDGEADFENKLVKDKSFIGTKADCVLNALINSGNNLFKKTVQAFTEGKSKFGLRFTAYNNSNDAADARTGLPGSDNIITVKVNLAVANSATSALELASMILHESIHAELHRIKLSNNSAPNSLPSSIYNWYVKMWSYYQAINDSKFDDPLKVLNQTATDSQHNLMAFRYITPIANGLREFDDNTHPLDNYKYLAAQGLLFYVKQNGYIKKDELNRLNQLSKTITNDTHKNPCD